MRVMSNKGSDIDLFIFRPQGGFMSAYGTRLVRSCSTEDLPEMSTFGNHGSTRQTESRHGKKSDRTTAYALTL